MKLITQKSAINLLFAFIFTTFILSIFYAYNQTQHRLDANKDAIQTYQIIRHIDTINTLFSEIESHISFNFLTYNTPSLVFLNNYFRNVDKEIISLSTLTNNNAEQQSNIKELREVAANRFSLAKNIIKNFESIKRQEIYTIMINNKRLNLKKQTLQILDKMRVHELAILYTRTKNLNEDIESNKETVRLVEFIGTLLLIFSFFFLNYFLNQRERDKKKLIEANNLLKVSEERFLLATEGSNAGLWDWNPGTDDVFYSTSFRKMLGYSLEEFPNKLDSFQRIVHPADEPKIWDAVDKHLYQHKPFKIEYRLRNKQGNIIWVEAAGQAIWDDNGVPIRMVGAIIDISERKELDKIKNEFIATVSHELKTPLTSISGSLELLMEEAAGKLSKQAQEFLCMAKNNSDRLTSLINDIMDIGNIELDECKFHMTPVFIKKVIIDVVKTAQAHSEKCGVCIEIENEIPNVLVKVDVNRLKQVFCHLISNAVKFSPQNSKVIISATKQRPNTLCISIRDSGCGIPLQFQGRVFQRFAQADSTPKRINGGAGLGLSISKLIIEKMHGNIRFESVLHQGSTFFIELPIIHKTDTDTFSKKSDTSKEY